MDSKIVNFQKLANEFDKHGYKLYLVGGTVRDYLLNEPLTDMDAVTDATPNEVLGFLPNADDSFARLGSLKYKDSSGIKFDITTLRKESGYTDSRHPNKVVFVKDLFEDYPRRDFTVNAMYMDKDLKVYDFCNGQKDLQNHTLRMVGDPDQRLKEDPLRILRAIRFCLMYKFAFSVDLLKAITDNIDLLKELKPQKIKQELKKIEGVSRQEMDALFSRLSIHEYLDMLE